MRLSATLDQGGGSVATNPTHDRCRSQQRALIDFPFHDTANKWPHLTELIGREFEEMGCR